VLKYLMWWQMTSIIQFIWMGLVWVYDVLYEFFDNNYNTIVEILSILILIIWLSLKYAYFLVYISLPFILPFIAIPSIILAKCTYTLIQYCANWGRLDVVVHSLKNLCATIVCRLVLILLFCKKVAMRSASFISEYNKPALIDVLITLNNILIFFDTK
jgi:hypothetical protein